MVALFFGRAAERRGVRTGKGLTQAVGTQPFASDKLREPAQLLLVSAPLAKQRVAQRIVHADGRSSRHASRVDLFEHHATGEIAHRRSAILFVNRRAQQAKLASGLNRSTRKLRFSVVLRGTA